MSEAPANSAERLVARQMHSSCRLSGRSMALLLVAALSLVGWSSECLAKELVKQGDGVRVYLLGETRGGLPRMVAETRVEGSVFEVLAVIMDVDRSCQWAGRCLIARIVERERLGRVRLYSRRKAPWPISDRDFELRTDVDIAAGGHRVTARFWNVADARTPRQAGVVRMPLLRGHYRLKRVSDRLTDVEFLIEANPGGWIPKWVVRWTAEALPYSSLRGLRRQVVRTRGKYAGVIKKIERAVAAGSPGAVGASTEPKPRRQGP